VHFVTAAVIFTWQLVYYFSELEILGSW